MDVFIVNPGHARIRKLAPVGVSIGVVTFVAWYLLSSLGEVQVRRNQVDITRVSKRVLHSDLTTRGTLEPTSSVLLEVVQGGLVKKVLAKAGSLLEKGQIIARVENAQLLLEVMDREAQVARQVNSLRETRITIEDEAFQLDMDRENVSYQIQHVSDEIRQTRALVRKHLSSAYHLTHLRDQLNHLIDKKKMIAARQKADTSYRNVQFKELRTTVDHLETQLKLAKTILHSLNIVAPMAGKLTDLKLQEGQLLAVGDHVGTIDSRDFKVVCDLPEYYLQQVTTGSRASANLNGWSRSMIVYRTSAQVTDGSYKAYLHFDHASGFPVTMSKGESVMVAFRLHQQGMRKVLTIPRSYLINTGNGFAAFVLDARTMIARRMPVKTGRQDSSYVEIVSGINQGQQIMKVPPGLETDQRIKVDE